MSFRAPNLPSHTTAGSASFSSEHILNSLPPLQATLEEVTQADLLLHVLDAASPQALQQRSAVLHVLRELGVPQSVLQERVIEVWNKVDCLAAPAAAGAQERSAAEARLEGGERQGPDGGLGDQGPGPAGEAVQQQSQQQQQEAVARGPPSQSGEDSRLQDASFDQQSSSARQEQVQSAWEPGGSDSSEASHRESQHAVAQLPPAVLALLEADRAAEGGDRPAAVAVSALRGDGLPELLSLVESKASLNLF
jgi:hypothetical protein